MQVNVHEAKTQLSRLLELVEEGETVVNRPPRPASGRAGAGAADTRRRLVAADERRRSRRLDRRAVKILTDTHTLVWALSSPEAPGGAARDAPGGSPFTASVANLWGLVLKVRKPGTLVAGPLPWWDKYVVRQGIRALSIRRPHIQALAGLPDVHKDPFDRLPVAQALAEGLTLASKDAILARHGVPLVWA